MKDDSEKLIRAIRVELMRPLGESWETIGPLLRLLARTTPRLLNAAHDVRIACEIAGSAAVKATIAPDAKAASAEGLAYQAVLKRTARLVAWGEKKEAPEATLAIPGAMSSAIARAASKAFSRRDQGRARFASERILVRAAETRLVRDDRGPVLELQLRPKHYVRFALAHSTGKHRTTLEAIIRGDIKRGDCKLQYDDERKKWYALLSYEQPVEAHPNLDKSVVLAVHRGVRNVLYMIDSVGGSGKPLSGSKFFGQRRGLRARMSEMRRTSQFERGSGAKGHGKSRRFESSHALEDKLARVTHTFCQQAGAFVAARAISVGAGTVFIEDYGGIEPDEDKSVRRLLDHGPLYQLKQCIASRLERDGIQLIDVPSLYISTTCPRCGAMDDSSHNRVTGIFHCRVCIFERPADWVAAYWMLKHGGADMTVWDDRLKREREFAERMRGVA